MRCLPMPTNPSSQSIEYPCPNANTLAPNSCGWWWFGPLAGVVLVSTIIRRPSQHLVDLPTLFCAGFAESIPVVHRCVKYDLSCLLICWEHWWVRGWLKRAPFRRRYPSHHFGGAKWRKTEKFLGVSGGRPKRVILIPSWYNLKNLLDVDSFRAIARPYHTKQACK